LEEALDLGVVEQLELIMNIGIGQHTFLYDILVFLHILDDIL